MKQPIILASQSPRRKQLLEWAKIPFEIHIKETDESYPPGLTKPDVAIHIAEQKALAVQPLVAKHSIILAADTIVVLDDKIIGKPRNREEAIQILTSLSGKTHQVITGVCILQNGIKNCFADTTQIVFHDLNQEQIEFYVDKYQPYDKAGAYAIQEWIGVVGIKSVSGDFYNVMGLPMSRVVRELERINEK